MALNPSNESPSKQDEEGITVAIRMRPLNNVEENNKRIWKVLPKYSSIAQTTRDGKPLPERISGRTFFTFDKTFGESTNNTQVYNGVAKGIVNSVVDGLNGTIFAYGQTSSGKTYTMQGAGNLEQGMGGEGGIVHMAANDIFSQIAKTQERNFLVRVSFLEIYNEEVRDLLGDTSKTIHIREDPRRGVFVQSQEEIVTNFDDLLQVLVHGDKSRTFASTGMNERSSRSHTILRITIESREKSKHDDENDDDSDSEMNSDGSKSSSDGAIRISTLNLVDLAGSESVRHTGATGDRQKEGGLINQSLLTLSRVIVALGSSNQFHINFRDSKLTRILQPSLSGNARMAVICCATPSELYIEETRSTLQFASRAKLVKTNAQVNEVLDDRSMIRKLQKELAEARRNQTGPGQGQLRNLEAQVATTATQAMEAKKKLDRLKASILNSGYNIIDQGPVVKADHAKKRRKSDGPLLNGLRSPSKEDKPEVKSPNTAPRRKKTKILQHKQLDIKQELKLVQEALATRNIFVRDLNQNLSKFSEEIKKKNSDVERMADENSILNKENIESKADVSNLQEMVASLKQSLDSSVQESKEALAEKDSTIMESFEKLQQTLRENEDSQKDNQDLIANLMEVENEKKALEERIASLEEQSRKEKEEFETKLGDLKKESDLALQDATNRLNDTSNDLQKQIEDLNSKIGESDVALQDATNRLNNTSNELQKQIALAEEKDLKIVAREEEIKKLSQQKKSLDDACKQSLGMIATLSKEKSSLETNVAALQEEAVKSKQEIESTQIKLSFTEEANTVVSEKLKEVEVELSNLRESNELASQSNESSLQSLKSELEAEKEAKAQLEETLSKTQQENESMESRLAENDEKLERETTYKSSLEATLAESQKLLEETKTSEKALKDTLEVLAGEKAQLESDLQKRDLKLRTMSAEQVAVVLSHQQNAVAMEGQMSRAQAQYDALYAEKENISNGFETMKQQFEATVSEAQSKFEEKQVEFAKLEAEKKALEDQIQEIEDFHTAKISSLAGDLEGQLEESERKIRALQHNLTSANSKLAEEVTKYVDEKKALDDHIQEIEDIHTAKFEELKSEKEQISKEMEGQLEQSKNQVQDLQNELAEQEIEKEALKTTLQEMEDTQSERESTVNELYAAIQEMEDISAVKDLELEKVVAEKEESINLLEQQLQDYREKISNLETTLEALESGNSEIERLQEDLSKKNLQIEELEKHALALNSQFEIQSNEIESLLVNLMEARTEKQHFESSYVELKSSCDSLTAENEAIHAKVSEIDERNTDIELELEALKIEYRLLLERNTALESSEKLMVESQVEKDNALAQYEEEVNDLSEQINTVFIEVTEFKERNDELTSYCEKLESENEAKTSEFLELQVEIKKMISSNEETVRNLRTCEAERDEANKENENLKGSNETLVGRLRDREAERDEATRELQKLYDENRDLNERMSDVVTKDKEDQLNEKIAELNSQNLELTHLLATVNESEERLRNAVKVAESNIMAKTSELEDAQYRISQLEQELSEVQSQGVEMSQIEESKADLVDEIETIRKEKEDIEKSLQEERDARATLQQQMGEEQRALIQEGENMMNELRQKLEESENNLKQSEAEAYNARQHIDEINDEKNRLEEKYLEASAQLNSSDSSKQRQEARITELESELNGAKSESYALKENIIDMKEKMRRSTRDSEKAIRECEIATSELSTMRRKLSSLENLNETHQMENSKLKKKMKQSEESNTLVASLREEIAAAETEISALKQEIEDLSSKPSATESTTDENQIQAMQNEINELKDSIKQKDKRIKKLEAVRLTKDRLAHISKMKADNEKYEKKVSKMEKEIDRLQSKMSSMGSEADTSSEISELRFDKEALERKLRKFATHCQQLEDDKAGIVDALGSCNIDVRDGDITEAVIQLCDEKTSIHEALEKQKSNKAFEKEKKSLQRNIEKLTEKLGQLEHENVELEAQLQNAEKEMATGHSEEHREKLRFLEQENLQLMQDVKSTKRQLQAAREEVVTLRMHVDQNPTSDFGNFDVRTSTRGTRSSLTTSSKEDSDTMELANLAAACSNNDTGTVLRRSTRKKRQVLSDNTNGTRNEERRTRSSTGKKRQKVNALFETKHAMNPMGNSTSENPAIEKAIAMNRTATPGLGETSSLDTENTGECKQS